MMGGEIVGLYNTTFNHPNNYTRAFLDDPLILDLETCLYSSDACSSYNYYYPSDPLLLPHQIFSSVINNDQFDDQYCYPAYSKRQKTCSSDQFDQHFNLKASTYLSSSSPELLFPNEVQQITTPLVYSEGYNNVDERSSNNSNKRGFGSEGNLLAQSVAARQRRRRITEKTQELGKLIPGGNKMNTAEMFQAAFKYIKFLQAQVGLLQLMASPTDHEDNIEDEASHSDHHREADQQLQVLLTSPAIQQKLYSGEKCLVPKELFETLAKHHEMKKDNLISKEDKQLVGSTK